MLPYARWIRWSALTGMLGQALFLVGFVLPYATLASGEQRWFLPLTGRKVLTTVQQGDVSSMFWALLILAPWVLYLLILLGFVGRGAPRWRLWVASTALISVLTLIAGGLLATIVIFVIFYNAPPARFRPPVPPLRYSPTFWLPLLGAWLSCGSSLALLRGLVGARQSRRRARQWPETASD